MRDKMQEPVCPKCGSGDYLMWNYGYDEADCLECRSACVEVESRAEYLAAHDDDPRDDPAVERAVGANTQEGE